MRELSDIRRQAEDMLSLIDEAYAVGRADGRREAADEFRTRISAALDDAPLEHDHRAAPATEHRPAESMICRDAEIDRAPQGTVRPTILTLIKDHPGLLTTGDINERTGFKPNSVRGTLYALQKENEITREDGRWRPVDWSEDRQPNPEQGAEIMSEGE